MPTYILANWKSNKTRSEAIVWLQTFLDIYEPQSHLKIIISPPNIYLEPLKQILDHRGGEGIYLAAQDLSPFPMGSYTGAIPADILKDLVDFAIVGHSERRRYFHESHSEIASKVSEAQDAGITPILCVDGPYAREQIATLDSSSLDKDLLIGYGPVDGVNLDIPHQPESQQEQILKIKKLAGDHPLLYGGSINPKNAQGYLALSGLSGLMIGSACLDPREFADICNTLRKSTVTT